MVANHLKPWLELKMFGCTEEAARPLVKLVKEGAGRLPLLKGREQKRLSEGNKYDDLTILHISHRYNGPCRANCDSITS